MLNRIADGQGGQTAQADTGGNGSLHGFVGTELKLHLHCGQLRDEPAVGRLSRP